MSFERDEPLTPAGRLFLRPEMNQVVLCILATKEKVNIDAIKSVVANSMLTKHPRLSSLLIVKNGQECWRKTEVDIDKHFIIHHDPIEGVEDDEEAANVYVADLAVSSPLETDKPLWEVHLSTFHKFAVIRVHHALGDGVSLLSFLMTMCRRADDPEKVPEMNVVVAGNRRESGGGGGGGVRGMWWRVVEVWWFTVVFVVDLVVRILWVRDEKTAVSGGAGVELWPRKLVTARFFIDDMKIVKKAIAKGTINDVLFGVISFGLSKYMDIRSPKGLKEGLRITGVALINLRPQGGMEDLSEMMKNKSKTGWGNKFGMLLLPVYYYRSSSDPLDFLRRAKAMIDQKKSSLEGLLSYKFMCILGSKLASLLNYRVLCNTTFTISNMVGPKENVTFAGHPVDYIKTTSTSLSHAITMHMMSYAGQAYLQILVAKDIVPDPEVLAKCLEDALLEMKEAATP